MPHSSLVRWFSRATRPAITYPPDFRRRYGHEMAQSSGTAAASCTCARSLWFGRLVANCALDWLITAIREGIAAMSTADQLSCCQEFA